MFKTFLDDVTQAWGGIKMAISAGRMDLAWKVITSSIKLEWARLTAWLKSSKKV